MSFTYSGDPADSESDEVRFYLSDTEAPAFLTDEEIQFLLDRWLPVYDSPIMVAAMAAEAISSKFIGETSITADGVSVDVSGLADRFQALAARLRVMYQEHGLGGEVDISNVMVGTSWDPRIRALMFGIGLHDNLEAGQQEYGGVNRYDAPETAQVSYLLEHADGQG